MLVGALTVLGVSAAPVTLTVFGLASGVASGALYYAGAYWFFLSALRHVPASRAMLAYYLIPVVGVAGAAILLGDRLQPWQWVGVALVMAAVWALARLPMRPHEPACTQSTTRSDLPHHQPCTPSCQ